MLNKPKLRTMDTFDLKEPMFLWYPYIPVGAATLIFGPGGAGKSHIAVDIAARLTTGRAFPEQKTALPAQNVLIMSAEDEPDMVLGPRLVKAGADLTRISVPDRTFTLDREGIKLVEEFMENMSAGIVFIDPIVAYIGSKVDMNKANETRSFTGGLHTLARKTGVPIIIIGHTRKGLEGSDAEKAMGSVDFINATRSALFTTTAPNGDRIMRHVKHNYSDEGKTLGYDFGDKGFEWTGVYTETGMFQGATSGSKKVNQIHLWLRDRLKDGPKRAVDMEKSGNELGFNHMALVRGKVGVAESYLVSENGKMSWYWKLLETSDEPADVPVMGVQWGAQKPDRVEREIIARTEERVRPAVKKVAKTRLAVIKTKQTPEEQLAAWSKELLG